MDVEYFIPTGVP